MADELVFHPLKLSARDEEWLLFQRYLQQQLCAPGETWEAFMVRMLGVPASELG